MAAIKSLICDGRPCNPKSNVDIFTPLWFFFLPKLGGDKTSDKIACRWFLSRRQELRAILLIIEFNLSNMCSRLRHTNPIAQIDSSITIANPIDPVDPELQGLANYLTGLE